MSHILVITTFSEKEDAKKFGELVIKKELGACVQILGPIESIYSWNDKVGDSEEYICFIKTKKDLYEELEELILEIHPYETPELIAVDIVEGSEEYLDWINHVTS